MLVLSRKKGESIIIGDGPDAITVVISEINGDRVRLGITAHKEIPIHRQEVKEILDQKRAMEDQLNRAGLTRTV